MRIDRGHTIGAVIGGLIVLLGLAALPAVAGDDDPLVLGQKNTAKTVTRLNTRGGLRIDNFKPGKPALILNVADNDTQPLLVNSEEMVRNLNADMVDGLDKYDLVEQGVRCVPGATMEGVGHSGQALCSADWGARPVQLVNDFGTQMFWTHHAPAIVMGSDDRPVLAFVWGYQPVQTAGQLVVVDCDDELCSGSQEVQILDDPVSWVNKDANVQIALTSTGRPVIAYHDDAGGGKLRLIYCTSTDCGFWDGPYDIATGDDYPVGLGTDGTDAIVLASDGAGGLTLYDCEGATCATNSWSGTGGSLAVNVWGEPAAAYYSASSDAIRLWRDGSTTEVIDAGTVGTKTAIDFGGAGDDPVVAYVDSNNGSTGTLRVVQCDDPNCAGTETANDVRINVSKTGELFIVSERGDPVLGFFVDADLWIARCLDEVCSEAELANVSDVSLVLHIDAVEDREAGSVLFVYDDSYRPGIGGVMRYP